MIEFRGIRKRFGDNLVLDGIDLTVATRRVTFIIGTSGTGKSVLMKHAVGLLAPDEGECRVDGERVDPQDQACLDRIRLRCSYVFQAGALLDSMRIVDNVALPLIQSGGLTPRQAEAQARAYLARCGVLAAADRSPAEVGGGVRKQAAVARALAIRPAYLILDEPTTSLDAVAARSLDRLTRRLVEEDGLTIVVVSHDLKSIFGIADDIVFLNRGRVRVQGPPEEIRRHEDPVLRDFLEGRPPVRQEQVYG